MTTQTVEDFLSGGGAPAAKFGTIGVTVKGTVEDVVVSQQTDMATGAPLTWEDGNPKLQLVITLATDERDDTITDDEGKRRVFAKGGMLAAIKDALKAAGVKSPEVGGTLAVQYAADGEPTRAGWNPPKQYRAQYASPAASTVNVDELI